METYTSRIATLLNLKILKSLRYFAMIMKLQANHLRKDVQKEGIIRTSVHGQVQKKCPGRL